ncbi:MAG: hypothetical protein Q8R33_22610 [Burkholderiales bacterium]|nr:hypothetical protein [Burkholderiales bacterium]
MTAGHQRPRPEGWQVGAFALSQIVVMLLAISNESLWIDEFWTAHFGAMESFKTFYDLLVVPSGSQTPLHFLHFYLWGLFSPAGEFFFRLANLPLFVAGQLAIFWALRDYPRQFAWLFLTLSALHPMVWQYANEARPYIMMYAGAQMILAYLLHLHAASAKGRSAEPFFLALFVVGGILLFGASMLGAFWVFAASVFVLVHHLRRSIWRELFRGVNPLLVGFMLLATGVLTAYYLNSLLKGAGASRLASSTPSTVLFAIYEVLGLAGIGPSRLELRTVGVTAVAPYATGLAAAGAVLVMVLFIGLKEARARLGTRELFWLTALGLFPIVVVVFSGFAMHWRVLGRHLIAALPLLNLLWALGLATLLQTNGRPGRHWHWHWRWLLAASALLFLLWSSCALRFAEHHRKDDYRAAAALAQTAVAQGQKVWWAADVIGARYYGLPGEFDVLGELTGMHKPLPCSDRPGVQAVANASRQCLLTLSVPDMVILSKPETFDISADIAGYLTAGKFTMAQRLPAFTIWLRSAPVAMQTR